MASLQELEKAAKEAADKLKACQIHLSVKKQAAASPVKMAGKMKLAIKAAEAKFKTACMEHSKAAKAKAVMLASKTATPKEKEEKTKAFDAALAKMNALEKECEKLKKELSDVGTNAKALEAAVKEAEAKYKAAKQASDKAAKALSDLKAANAMKARKVNPTKIK